MAVVPFLQNKEVSCKEKRGFFEGSEIRCCCCRELFAPSKWEDHCGGKWHRPWQKIILVESGRNIQFHREEYEASVSTSASSKRKSAVIPISLKERKQRRLPSAPVDLSNLKEQQVLIETAQSPLADFSLMKKIVCKESFLMLNTEERQRLMEFLPEVDQVNDDTVINLFNHSGFEESLFHYTLMLAQGDFDPACTQRIENERTRFFALQDDWKRSHYEEYWGQTLHLSIPSTVPGISKM